MPVSNSSPTSLVICVLIKILTFLIFLTCSTLALANTLLKDESIENEYLDVDFNSLIQDYHKLNNNPFYYDYFRFLVLVIYIKKIMIKP